VNFETGTTKRKNYLKRFLKKFIKEPILRIYQPELLIRVEIDASDFILGVCLLQKYSKVWHLVAYYS